MSINLSLRNRLSYRRVMDRMFSTCEVCFYDGNEMIAKNNLSFAQIDSFVKDATTLEERIKHVSHNEVTGKTKIDNKEIACKLYQRFIDEGLIYSHFDGFKYWINKVTLTRK